MDDFQTQYLEALAAEARAQETLLDRARTILQNPKQHGWETMARAAVVLPLVGIGAALARSALAQRKRASAVWLPMLAGLVGALVFLLIAAAPLASLVARFVRL